MAIASISGLADALDDRSLFEAAIAPDAPVTEQQPPEPGAADAVREPAPEGAEPVREVAPEQPAPGEEFVPSWRLREEREAREAYAGRLAERERQLTEALSYLRQVQVAQQAPVPPIDPVVDPAAFHRAQADVVTQMRAEFSNQMRTLQLENNLQLTRLQAGPELFDEAYQAFVETASGDQSFARAIVSSPNPGAAMCNWYRQAVTLNRIGPDPEAWFDAQKAALLQDPEFLQTAVEAARNYQPPAQERDTQGRFTSNMRPSASSNVTVLPPSLMRMRGSTTSEATGASIGGDDPLSDNSLFAFATRAK